MSDQIRIGRKQAYRSVSGNRILKYVVEMYHEGLNEHKVISAPDEYMLDNKIRAQERKWMEKWEITSSRRRINEEKEANLEEASRRTEDAANALKGIEDILVYS